MKYYPVRIKNVGEQQKADRQTIWDFKDGRAYEQVALMTAKHLQELFGSRLTSIVFTCVPASTQEKNELRYKRFSERVCELTHAINGYPHMRHKWQTMTLISSRAKMCCSLTTSSPKAYPTPPQSTTWKRVGQTCWAVCSWQRHSTRYDDDTDRHYKDGSVHRTPFYPLQGQTAVENQS